MRSHRSLCPTISSCFCRRLTRARTKRSSTHVRQTLGNSCRRDDRRQYRYAWRYRPEFLSLIPFLRAFSGLLCAHREPADDLAQSLARRGKRVQESGEDPISRHGCLRASEINLTRTGGAWRQKPWDDRLTQCTGGRRTASPGAFAQRILCHLAPIHEEWGSGARLRGWLRFMTCEPR
jgi:hypothetical protein